MITALKTGNIRELAKYEDISMADVDFPALLNRSKEFISLALKAKEIRKKQNRQNKEEIDNIKARQF